MKKLILFDEIEYRKALAQSQRKLDAWYKVAEEVEKLIALPSTKQQYDSLMANPLDYVTKAIEDKHRPNINIPVSTEKLFELLEIDLTALKQAILPYIKLSGKLVFVSSKNLSTVVDKEDYMIYAEGEKEIERLDASLNLIEAFSRLMTLNNKDFEKYGNSNLHKLKDATGHIIEWVNGKLIPKVYWIKS